MNWVLLPDEELSMASFDPGERRVMIVADTDAGRSAAETLATGLGAHILFAGDLHEAIIRLNDGVTGEFVIIDIAHDNGAVLDRFLSALQVVVHRVPVLVNASAAVLDVVAAQLTAPRVTIMSDATTSDWVTALSLLRQDSALGLHDAASDETLRLQRLAEEVGRIARTLADLASVEPSTSAFGDALIGYRAEPVLSRTADPMAPTAADVRAIIRLRRMRERFFRAELFADPAWDMLLDLMAARLEHLRVAVSSLCIAAAVPPTTALRWIKTMTDNGLFVRVADPADGRRVFIALSDGAAAGMAAYLTAAKATGGLAV